MVTAPLEAAKERETTTPCPKCNCAFSRTEEDAVGSMRTCTRCGHCTYLDREGNIIMEQGQLSSTTQSTPAVAPEPAPTGTPEAIATIFPEIEEIRLDVAETECPGKFPWDIPGNGEDDPGTGGDGPEDSPAGPWEERNCPGCGAAVDREDAARFRRLALLRCRSCGHWNLNPEAGESLDSREKAIGAAMQMNLDGTTTRDIIDRMEGLSPDTNISQQNLSWWTKRYGAPAAEAMREMRPPTASRTWEIDAVSFRMRSRDWLFWTVTDQMTQYVLATGRTDARGTCTALLEMAELVSGEKPTNIILASSIPEGTAALEQYDGEGADIIRQPPSGENPDGSMARLRKSVQQRLEGPSGKMTLENADMALAQVVMSINLFEEQPGTGTTPAENAGLKSPYRNWQELVETEAKNPPPEGARNRRQRNEEGQIPGAEADSRDEETPAGEDAGEAQEGEHTPGPATSPPAGQEEGNGEQDGTDAPEAAGMPAGTGEMTLRELLDRLNRQAEEAHRKYLEIVQTRESVEEIIRFMEMEESPRAA